jgi:tetratricopeptide (TPR) repeat protein
MKLTLVITLALGLLAPGLRATDTTEAYRLGALARLAEMDGKHSEALNYFNQSLALVPDAIIYGERATLKADMNDIKGAIADYDKAIALKPGPEDLATLHGNRGSLKAQLEDYAGALADYDHVIALRPNEAVVYNNRGAIKAGRGDQAGAIADYTKAIALEPANQQFYVNRAGARMKHGDRAGAGADFDQTVALAPKEPDTYYARANFRRLTGDFDGAIKDYDKVIELRPDLWIGTFCRAVTRHAEGELEAAIKDYDLALSGAANDRAYIAPYREIALRQLHRGTPFAELAKTVAQWKEGWSKTVGLYLIEAIPEPVFFDQAGQGPANFVPAQKCAAFYYAGITRLLAGNPTAARGFFEQSIATERSECDEFILARAELARLPK